LTFATKLYCGSNIELEIIDASKASDVDCEEKKSECLPDTKAAQNLMKCFLLSLSYASNIGGSGSLVGTPPNLVLKGFYDQNYPNGGLNFLTFMIYSLPCGFLMIIVSWLLMLFVWLPRHYFVRVFTNIRDLILRRKTPHVPNEVKEDKLKKFIREEYEKLGPLK